jgi:hypothetical protein
LESSIGFNFFNSDFNLGGFNLSFFDYHVISFGGFKANTGDIEGRLAARGTVDLGYGFSVADKIEPKEEENETNEYAISTKSVEEHVKEMKSEYENVGFLTRWGIYLTSRALKQFFDGYTEEDFLMGSNNGFLVISKLNLISNTKRFIKINFNR